MNLSFIFLLGIPLYKTPYVVVLFIFITCFFAGCLSCNYGPVIGLAESVVEIDEPMFQQSNVHSMPGLLQ